MCILYLFLYLTGILYQCTETDSALFTIPQDSRKSFTIVAKNKDFVEDIKGELRQNNDDYLESSSLTPTSPQIREKETWNEGRRALNKDLSSSTKTSFFPFPVDSPSEESSITEERENAVDISTIKQSKEYVSSKWTVVRRVNNRSPSPSDWKVETATTQTYVIPEAHSISQKGKMKNLLQSLVKEGASTFRAAEGTPVLRGHGARAGHGLYEGYRDYTLSHERLPNSKQLDMAPAIGDKVERLRTKNRMCQRHVLLPEGPKYNSRGRIYLQAYSPRARGLDYARTRPRKFLLPRCCNCCKKSVLGCE